MTDLNHNVFQTNVNRFLPYTPVAMNGENLNSVAGVSVHIASKLEFKNNTAVPFQRINQDFFTTL